ncbi:hypothetical protein [Coleofasciculus sp. FACHB-1120]|nr:hypothetical protein [Coleofasciculus sp. FACHB-1120]
MDFSQGDIYSFQAHLAHLISVRSDRIFTVIAPINSSQGAIAPIN